MLDSQRSARISPELALGMINCRSQTVHSSQVNHSKRHMSGNPTYEGKSHSLGIKWSISSILADALLVDPRREKKRANYDSDQDTRCSQT